MYLKNISLKNFRNYDYETINFSKNLNIIIGDNAQGKTNILEAIYICAIGKSFRTNKDIELIYFNNDYYNIELDFFKQNRDQKIMIGFERSKGKLIKANGIKMNKFGELIGNILVVLFNPDDLRMIKDSPNYRRKFLDILLSQIKKTYLYNLQQYNKILNQRNALLKQLKFNSNSNNIEVLNILDETLAKIIVKVINKRVEYVDKLQKIAQKIHYKLTNDKEILKIIYKNSTICDKITNVTEEEDIKACINKLFEKREVDIMRGFTSIGPHRDDLLILINDLDIEKYGSQGQQRTVVLSLKLAELEIIKRELIETPILLLDDVFSELDEKRKKFLLESIKEYQVFLTTTNFENIEANIINIKAGKLVNIIN